MLCVVCVFADESSSEEEMEVAESPAARPHGKFVEGVNGIYEGTYLVLPLFTLCTLSVEHNISHREKKYYQLLSYGGSCFSFRRLLMCDDFRYYGQAINIISADIE